jgi:gluconolactonase
MSQTSTVHPARVLVDGTLGDPRLDHPEGVAVAPDGSVWCGGERGQIYRVDADAGTFEQVASTGGFCLGLAFDARGDLYVCDVAHRAVLRLALPGGRGLQTFAEGAGGRRFRNPNALAFDAAGRLYVSDSLAPGEPGPGLFRLEPDGSGELWHDEPLDFANGLALSPDGDAICVAETWARRITRIEIEPDGSAGARSIVAELDDALPDGLAFDAQGRLYVACYEPSQILRIEPDGAVEVLHRDPTAHLLCHPTNVAFRGETLIAANLGRWHLTAIDAGATGVPLPPRAEASR